MRLSSRSLENVPRADCRKPQRPQLPQRPLLAALSDGVFGTPLQNRRPFSHQGSRSHSEGLALSNYGVIGQTMHTRLFPRPLETFFYQHDPLGVCSGRRTYQVLQVLWTPLLVGAPGTGKLHSHSVRTQDHSFLLGVSITGRCSYLVTVIPRNKELTKSHF